jgi:hypothetical protein
MTEVKTSQKDDQKQSTEENNKVVPETPSNTK